MNTLTPATSATHVPGGAWFVHEPVAALPDCWLIEAEHDGHQHTIALCPVAMLPVPVIKANAEFIVRAANSHDALLSACESALNTLRDLSCHHDLIEQLDNAVAKANTRRKIKYEA